jgi:hypothetical protein
LGQNYRDADGVGTNAYFGVVNAMASDHSGNIILGCGTSVRKMSTNITTIAGNFTQSGRRFVIYKAAKEFLVAIMSDPNTTKGDHLMTYLQGTQDAEFLFGKDIVDYLDSLWNRTLKMWDLQREYGPLQPGEKRKELYEKEGQIRKDLTNEIRSLPKVFGPYMRFKNWNSTATWEISNRPCRLKRKERRSLQAESLLTQPEELLCVRNGIQEVSPAASWSLHFEELLGNR